MAKRQRIIGSPMGGGDQPDPPRPSNISPDGRLDLELLANSTNGNPVGATKSPPGMQIGTLPTASRMPMQFSPELANALRDARDNHGGRFFVMIGTADHNPTELNPHNFRVDGFFARGDRWDDDWMIRLHALLVGKMLEVPGTLAAAVAANGNGNANVK